MKITKLLLSAIAVISIALPSEARTWRVNPNQNSGAQYTNLTDLQNDADFAEGDVIVCDPGVYGTILSSQRTILHF